MNWEQEQLTNWIREAIRIGCVGGCWKGRFPKYAWFRDREVVYEGRLVNKGNGDYKGYALTDDETPEGIDEYYV
ncbi:MAG: hypothetical protein H6751_12390 [Candidatus Omnitrophica bacterium]|nr:hypothetical protein [Candidatus Omnitrophota bacterium]MCB9783754.1 hypothetical protein [Candidatus Omnitrophota bacterium]